MENVIREINTKTWRDCLLDGFQIDFEEIFINIANNIGETIQICCKNYIGFCYIGHWDESVILDITVETFGNVIEESIRTITKLYGNHPLAGGGVKNIGDPWYQVEIKLIDGNSIKIACNSIVIISNGAI